MVVTDRQGLVESLHAEAGDSLRVVATYDRDGYEAFHVRDDVTPRLAERADDVHEELVLQGIGRGHLKGLFDAGELHCSMHRFDDLTAFHFVAGEHSGLFVSIDSDVDVPLASFAGACRTHL